MQPPSTRREPVGSEELPPVTPCTGVRIQRIALVVLVVIAFLAAAWVASSLWAGLLIGLLTAFTIEPWYQWALRRFPRRPGVLAAASVSAVALGCAAIVAALSAVLTRELFDAASALQEHARGFSFTTVLSPGLTRRLGALGVTPGLLGERLVRVADQAVAMASQLAGAVVGSTFSILGGALIAFVTAFYTLKDSRPIERRLAEVLPLDPQTTRELVSDFRKVGRGTLTGSVFAALIQGALGGVGYALGGVPRAALFGLITALASFIPVLGTLLVWIPISVALVIDGRIAAAIFELAWGLLVTTTLVDYVIRPVVVGRGSRSHPLVFLVGVIGGLEAFGGVGVIAGPIVMAFFISVLRIYRREVVVRAHTAAE